MTLDRWKMFSFAFQMGSIGAEVARVFLLQAQGSLENSANAFMRAVELLDLTLQDNKNSMHQKELCRLREVLADYFFGNAYQSNPQQWNDYFSHFAIIAATKREIKT